MINSTISPRELQRPKFNPSDFYITDAGLGVLVTTSEPLSTKTQWTAKCRTRKPEVGSVMGLLTASWAFQVHYISALVKVLKSSEEEGLCSVCILDSDENEWRASETGLVLKPKPNKENINSVLHRIPVEKLVFLREHNNKTQS